MKIKCLIASLSIVVLSFFPSNSFASHMYGGEISWECDTSGAYIFKMILYRDCDGISHTYTNTILSVHGNSLPTNISGSAISSIAIMPDSARWRQMNMGYLDPNCRPGSFQSTLSCRNGDVGTIQRFYYKSNPIQLHGIPPASGWRFVYDLACCRANDINNLAMGGSQILQAKMYSTGTNTFPCLDNSPQFIMPHQQLFCRKTKGYQVYSAQDIDGDSLVYKLGNTYNTPASAPNIVPFANRYSVNNPTPDATFNAQNIPFTLNSKTGNAEFAIYNGAYSGLFRYMVSVEVWAYRNGQLISTTNRESVIQLIDCPPVSTTTGIRNSSPIINPLFLNASGSASFYDTVIVGNLLSANLFVQDTNTVNGGMQTISLKIRGENMATDYRFGGPCPNPADSNCAGITTIVPVVFDSTAQAYQLENSGSVRGIFRWRPDCSDLYSNNAPKTHYFYLEAQDYYCPLPAISHEVMAITVMPDTNNPCSRITSVIQNDLQKRVTVYPNPTSGLIYLRFDKSGSYTVRIRDLQGRLVQSLNHINSEASITLDSPAGIYFLEISNQAGERVFKKIVKR